jgi:hypothetical protein
MNEHHVIADEVLENIDIAISKGNNWMAYNNSLYFIDKNDIQFFDNQSSANEFANNNASDYDNYTVMYVSSIADVLRKVPFRESPENQRRDPNANGLYNTDGNAFTFAYIDYIEKPKILTNKNDKDMNSENFYDLNGTVYEERRIKHQDDILSLFKNNTMNQENLKYLTDNIKYMGFGEKLNEALQNNLKEGKPEFQLSYKAEINKKPFEATLHFRKSENSDMYFFNSYQANLQKSNGDKVEQTFYLNKGKGFTMKEAFNLLDGRSVNKELTNKEGQSYNAWVQLDFEKKDKHNNFEMKQFHENYGFDLKEAVGKYAIPGIKDPKQEDALMQSLQKGNLQAVNVEKDGSTRMMFIEANPQFKSVNLYDGQMNRVQKEGTEQYQSNGQLQSKEVKQDVKKNDDLKPDVAKENKENEKQIKPDATKENKQEATKENKQGVKKENRQKNSLLPKKQNGNGLLEKKRVSAKKGLAV